MPKKKAPDLVDPDQNVPLTQEAVDYTKMRDGQSKPIAVEFLRFLVSLPDLEQGLGIQSAEEKYQYWNSVLEKFVEYLRNKQDVPLSYFEHAFSLAKEAIEDLKYAYDELMFDKKEYVVRQFWGDKYKEEITLQDVETKEYTYRLEEKKKLEEQAKTVDKQ